MAEIIVGFVLGAGATFGGLYWLSQRLTRSAIAKPTADDDQAIGENIVVRKGQNHVATTIH